MAERIYKDFAELGVSLTKFSKAARVTVEVAVRRIALQIYREVMQRTPVDTGRARAGWQVTIGSPGSYIPPEPTRKRRGTLNRTVEEGKTRDASHSNGRGPNELSTFKAGDVVYIVNNVHYIIYLEEGTSKQAPAGMVRVTLAKVKTELEAIIRLNS